MGTPLRVLLIDDSPSDADLLLRTLDRGQYTVESRRVDSEAALSAALDESWDLVLCDWRMPGFGGPEALAVLRERAIDAPIIIVSSDLGEDGALTAMKGGANDYVAKHALVRLVPAIERELREAETRRALRASEERFGKAFEYAPIGMAVISVGGVVLRVNPAMCAMFGYSEPEMRELRAWQLTHPDDLAATFEQLARLLDGEISTWHIERRYLHRDGRILWGRSTTWLVRDAQGVGQYVVSQIADITDWKRLEEQTRRQQAELAHRLRIATFGETLAQVAHEINQPLASIANFANGILTRLSRHALDAEATRGAAAAIVDETVRADRVLQRLRSLLAHGESKLERCDANDVVRDAVRLIEPELSRQAIRLDLALAPGPLPVEVDRVQVEQVLVNLLQNAVEAIAASDDDWRDLAVESTLRDGRQIAVSVRDSGIGLPDAKSDDIFTPFFTTKRGGLGLGLSICSSIVQAHGGALYARANDPRGATVGFVLPAA
jgi:two-component system sensor histidine kinase DctS